MGVMSPQRTKVLEMARLLEANFGSFTIPEVIEATEMTPDAARTQILRLRKMDLILPHRNESGAVVSRLCTSSNQTKRAWTLVPKAHERAEQISRECLYRMLVGQAATFAEEPEPELATPTTARPGTRRKVAVMADRARRGLAVFHPDDHGHGGEALGYA